MPAAATCAASASYPASGSGAVSCALPSAFASLWSKLLIASDPSGFVRPPIVRSPLATSTRLPLSVPLRFDRALPVDRRDEAMVRAELVQRHADRKELAHGRDHRRRCGVLCVDHAPALEIDHLQRPHRFL